MSTQHWLFQANPKVFQLQQALRAEVLDSFTVRSHKDKIHPGDKVILWLSGKNAACYGLAEVTSVVQEQPIGEAEKAYFLEVPPNNQPRVQIRILYNLWDRPITPDLLPDSSIFEEFNAGLPGTNFKASKAQYDAIEQLVVQHDVVHEPEPEYETPDWIGHPLNLILYGPPGTGKTYQTVNHALAVIENRSLEEIELEDRTILRKRFNQYVSAGQIAFVSFHPSFSYEDFVEGIRAETRNGQIHYSIQQGIFKTMALEARRCLYEAYLEDQSVQQQTIAFNQLYSAFLQYLKSSAFSHFVAPSKKPVFLHRVLRFGNLAVRTAQSFAVKTVEKSVLQKLYHQLKDSDQHPSPSDLKALINRDNPSAYLAVLITLKAFESDYLQEQNPIDPVGNAQLELPHISRRILAKCKRYVLIMDELNRGNTAAIFGELISLIEADKREGAREAMSTVLPYSKTYFSVPPNLYLVGTMNTADRSTEVLDLALRRRFAFRQMLPRPEIIPHKARQAIIAGVDLQKMLRCINQRLVYLLDEEHQIGHAYLMEVVQLDDLIQVFENRIIPLLQTYFFNDLGKLGLVLGRSFVQKAPQTGDSGTIFASFDHPYSGEFAERQQYVLTNPEKWDESTFIQIYDPSYQ